MLGAEPHFSGKHQYKSTTVAILAQVFRSSGGCPNIWRMSSAHESDFEMAGDGANASDFETAGDGADFATKRRRKRGLLKQASSAALCMFLIVDSTVSITPWT